jgi:hypothetical protein
MVSGFYMALHSKFYKHKKEVHEVMLKNRNMRELHKHYTFSSLKVETKV